MRKFVRPDERIFYQTVFVCIKWNKMICFVNTALELLLYVCYYYVRDRFERKQPKVKDSMNKKKNGAFENNVCTMCSMFDMRILRFFLLFSSLNRKFSNWIFVFLSTNEWIWIVWILFILWIEQNPMKWTNPFEYINYIILTYLCVTDCIFDSVYSHIYVGWMGISYQSLNWNIALHWTKWY